MTARAHVGILTSWLMCSPHAESGPRWPPALASWENGKVVLAFSTNLSGMDQYCVGVRLCQW